LGERIVPDLDLENAYVRQKSWIDRRIRENRERYGEEALFVGNGGDDEGSGIDETDDAEE
jgi:hypothetical protein